jgi:hypothetical protein
MTVHIVNEIPEPNDRADIDRGVNEAFRDRVKDEEWFVDIRPDAFKLNIYVVFLTGPKGFKQRLEFEALTLESAHVRDTIKSVLDKK